MITSREHYLSPQRQWGIRVVDWQDHWRVVVSWGHRRRAWNFARKAKA